jgi:hypothetical protein
MVSSVLVEQVEVVVSVHESERRDTSTTRKRVGTSALAQQLTRLRVVLVSALLSARERLRVVERTLDAASPTRVYCHPSGFLAQ